MLMQDEPVLDLAHLDKAPRHLTPHEGQAHFEESAFSVDGRTLYCITDQGRNDVLYSAGRMRRIAPSRSSVAA